MVRFGPGQAPREPGPNLSEPVRKLFSAGRLVNLSRTGPNRPKPSSGRPRTALNSVRKLLWLGQVQTGLDHVPREPVRTCPGSGMSEPDHERPSLDSRRSDVWLTTSTARRRGAAARRPEGGARTEVGSSFPNGVFRNPRLGWASRLGWPQCWRPAATCFLLPPKEVSRFSIFMRDRFA